CTSAERIHVPAAQPSLPAPSPSATCTGGDGEALFRALLVDLGVGRQDLVAAYFTPADRFVRWIDPSTPDGLTELPDPADGHPALNDLRDHLNALAAGGFQESVVSFDDLGYGGAAAGEEGGLFFFEMLGRPAETDPVETGNGRGTVDCATGLLREVDIG